MLHAQTGVIRVRRTFPTTYQSDAMLKRSTSGTNTEVYTYCGNSQWSCPSDNCTTDFKFPINPDLVLRDYQVASLGLQGPVTVLATSVAASNPASMRGASKTATMPSLTSCPAFPTTTACDGATSPSQSKVTAVGAGIGVPLGVAALSFLGLFLWERKRNRRLQSSFINAPVANADPVPRYTSLPQDREQPFSPMSSTEERSPSELTAQPKPPAELPHAI